MKLIIQALSMWLMGVFFLSTAQAAGMNGNGVYASQYNPWRPQPQQWGGYNRRPSNTQNHGVMPQPLYPPQQSRIPARQFEYRRYIQQVNPYYSNQMPWWSDQTAVPYGPWSSGKSGPSGFW